ncbi:MAG: ATP-binding cassette domain-containing protein [Bacteroidia bacterium]|nr:ATP-binding cassette domain-containing protein [Bacteroidia bacterium]
MTTIEKPNLSIQLIDAAVHNGTDMVLSDINIAISKGGFAYLIGKTGSGKSSLLKTLYAAQPLKLGEGIVAGYNLEEMTFRTIPHLRRRLGIVFQDFNLIEDMTSAENLSFILASTGWKRKQAIQERVGETLESVGLFGVEQKFPHQLSGGEQQRLVIARAIVNKPELIIADEPTGNLDPETTDEIMQLLLSINRNSNTTILFATHDYVLLEKYPNRILECIDGQVRERVDIPIS